MKKEIITIAVYCDKCRKLIEGNLYWHVTQNDIEKHYHENCYKPEKNILKSNVAS